MNSRISSVVKKIVPQFLKFVLAHLLGLMLTGPGSAQDQVAETGELLASKLEEPFAPPSISIAVGVGNEVVLSEAVGDADLAAKMPATPKTVYRAYSIAKGVTAIAVMQLVERGQVNLDDDIRKYVPTFPEKKWPIQIQHLLTHTSGIRHYKKNAGEISSTTQYPSLEKAIEIFKDDPLEFQPGTNHRYTSFGFNLLTGVIEQVSDKSYEEYIRQEIFKPAQMTRSSLAVAGRETKNLASPYWRPRTETGLNWPIKDPLPNVSGRYGSSGLVSTPEDLVKLIFAVRQHKLLKPETVKQMFTVAFPKIDPTQAYGWNVEIENNRRLVYVSGASTGYTAVLVNYPDQQLTGAMLVNQNQYKERWKLMEELLKPWLEETADRN